MDHVTSSLEAFTATPLSGFRWPVWGQKNVVTWISWRSSSVFTPQTTNRHADDGLQWLPPALTSWDRGNVYVLFPCPRMLLVGAAIRRSPYCPTVRELSCGSVMILRPLKVKICKCKMKRTSSAGFVQATSYRPVSFFTYRLKNGRVWCSFGAFYLAIQVIG